MKIGIYTPYLDTLTGGERYMLTIAECLSSTHSVDVFWDNPKILEQAQVKLGIDTSKLQIVPNILKDPLIHKLKQTAGYDCLIVLSDGSIPFVLSRKLILHFQHPVNWVHPNTFTRLKMKKVSLVICNSQFTKRDIDNTYGINSTVLFPPVNVSEFKSSEKKENVIVTVGRFAMFPNGSTYKKHEVLIEVFKKMVDEGLKRWKLEIITSFRDVDKEKIHELRDSVKGYPIEFFANLPNKNVKRHYSKAKIYWHAAGFGENLEQHPEYAEHFGIATVEAIAAGCIPIVFGAGGQKEIVTEGLGFTYNTKAELENLTKDVISGEKSINIDNAISQIALYSTENFCRKVLELIEKDK